MDELKIVKKLKPIKILNFSDECYRVLNLCKEELPKEFPTLTIDLDYFLFACFADKKNLLYKRLDNRLMSSSLDSIYDTWYQTLSAKSLNAIKPNREPVLSEDFFKAIVTANEEAISLGTSEITTEHIFLAILKDESPNNLIRVVFTKAGGITYQILKSQLENEMYELENSKPDFIENKESVDDDDANFKSKKKQNRRNNQVSAILSQAPITGNPTIKSSGNYSYIETYCTNLNRLAEEGKISPLIGRDKEMEEIIRILGRKNKNNAILLGGEGVGKTAIGEYLAVNIVNGNVPGFLSDKELVSLDMTALMAGTTLRGMFEERVKGILDEIKANNKYILFMDNIGAILADKGKNDYEISAMLSRSLETGELQVIGTSDFASYRKTFDKDPSLARRFQKIIVEAPTPLETIDIIFGIRKSYEEFHGVKYTDDALKACVKLANKYITERNLPDSAIDILDESGAYVGTGNEPETVRVLRNKIKYTETEISTSKKNGDYATSNRKEEYLSWLKASFEKAKKEMIENRKNNPKIIDVDDILSIVAKKTGIPITNLTSDDRQKLATINDRLKSEIIGQDDAIDTVCKALKRNRIGLTKNGCMFSAMMIGKSGVGKTLLAKKLAQELFGNEKALVRFDMSEFSDKVAVNKLIGSNPGYVGYEEGGQLTEAIKNKKHCVLLLDEIEKADSEIYNVFLQVLDEGFLTDNSGQKIDFKNVIVIFTSNIGVKSAGEFGNGIGFNEDKDQNTKKILLKHLKSKFPPEFLNRIDNIVYFNQLNDKDLKKIINIEIDKLSDRLSNIGYNLKVTDQVVDYILEYVKNDKEYGARPIIRAIQDIIENQITDLLIEKSFDENYTFTTKIDKDTECVVVR